MFVSKGPINNIPALVQIMAWRRPGDKPLSEPVMLSLLKHICVTRPPWVNNGDATVLHFQEFMVGSQLILYSALVSFGKGIKEVLFMSAIHYIMSDFKEVMKEW